LLKTSTFNTAKYQREPRYHGKMYNKIEAAVHIAWLARLCKYTE
jgi:hypothetical protein